MFCEIPEFGRCCFCLPLRRGVLVFGYINVLFSAFMVGMYSYLVHHDLDRAGHYSIILFKGVTSEKLTALCIFIYCIEVIVNCLLVFGAHVKNILFLKIFYYYSVTTLLAALLLQIIEFFQDSRFFEVLVFGFAMICIQCYLIFLVRSLLKKLEIGNSHAYDNQLHTITVGEARVENGVYNNTTVVPTK